MAVMDDRVYHSTDALIHQKPRQHFRVGLHVEHWQLRSQIGLSSPHHVYYVGGNGNRQIYKLDKVTHETKTIKFLPFAPRCLVAKNGWLCVGGEYGEFIVFSPGKPDSTSPNNRHNESEDDSWAFLLDYLHHGPGDVDPAESLDAVQRHIRRLPLEDRLHLIDRLHLDDRLRPVERIQPSRAGNAANPEGSLPPRSQADSDKGLYARSKRFGRERVNCITLWFPQSPEVERFSGAYSQPVAVLANNDKNVTVVDLTSLTSLDEISLPDCVNRALISPDGRLLVAVCDDPYLYVYERVREQTDRQGPSTHNTFEWRQSVRVHLQSQRKDDRSDQRGSFAACFSNTGRLLAVGTQYGVISIFDVSLLTQPGCDPLVTAFTSSRPREDVGAVRDMAFCPGPFDLLAWTEHRGRVGVADIRSNYVSRQTLNLDDHDAYEQITVTERGSAEVPPLDLSASGELGTIDAYRAEARRLRQAMDHHPPLTTDETLVLDALQEHRLRREQYSAAIRNQASPTPTATTSRLLENLQGRRTSALSLSDRDARIRAEADPIWTSRDHLGEIQSQQNRIRDQAERVREQTERLRSRRFAVDELERRRLADTSRNLAPLLLPHNTAESLRRIYGSSLEYLNPPSLRAAAYNGGTSGPGGASRNGAAAGTGGASGAGSGPNESGRGESTDPRSSDEVNNVWATLLRDRPMEWEIPREVSRPRRAERVFNVTAGSRIDREPDDTAGLAWSDDGQTLIIGAEDGIYEFHINVLNRKVYPSVEMR